MAQQTSAPAQAETALPELDVTGPVLLFDGVCNLCHASVRFVLERDPRRRFRFASIQSDVGRRYLQRFGMPEDALNTMVLVEDGRAYRESAAGLRVTRRLTAPWPLVYGCIIIPAPLRDAVYRFIARNRYRWFGKRDVCSLPSAADAARFLDGAEISDGRA